MLKVKITREQLARIASLADLQEADEVIIEDNYYAGSVSALFQSDDGACRARYEIQSDGEID